MQFAYVGEGSEVSQINEPDSSNAFQLAVFRGGGNSEQINKGNAKNNNQYIFGGHGVQKNEEGSDGNMVYNYRKCEPGEESSISSDKTNTRIVFCINDFNRLARDFIQMFNLENNVNEILKRHNLLK